MQGGHSVFATHRSSGSVLPQLCRLHAHQNRSNSGNFCIRDRCRTSYDYLRASNQRSLCFSVSVRRRNWMFVEVHATAGGTDQPKWWEKNAGPNMVDIHSTQEFLDALSQAGDRLVIVDFYGTWCASCRALFPKLCKIADEHPEILFLKVNFDDNKSLCKSLNIKVLPYFHFYKGAKGQVEAFSCSLAKLQRLKDAIAAHTVPDAQSSPPRNKSDGCLTVSETSEASKEKPL